MSRFGAQEPPRRPPGSLRLFLTCVGLLVAVLVGGALVGFELLLAFLHLVRSWS